MGGGVFRGRAGSLRETWGWDENWTLSEWPITNDRPTDYTLIIQRWYGNGGHLLCKAQTIPSHNQYPLLSNMPSTWLPPLSAMASRRAERTVITCVCMWASVHVQMENYFQMYCSNTNTHCNNGAPEKKTLLGSRILHSDQVLLSTWNPPPPPSSIALVPDRGDMT